MTRAYDPLSHDLYAAPSLIHGRGCFARRGFAPGEFIGTFQGSEVDEDGSHVLWIYDAGNGILIRRRGNNLLRWLNHSDRPNAAFNGLDLYASASIRVDDEITIDYGRSCSSEDGIYLAPDEAAA